MNRRYLSFLLFLLYWSLLPVAGIAAEERIKIGVSVPLTGNSAGYGADIRNFLLFAAEDLAPGGYELIIEDDQCSGKAASSVAHKFINLDRVHYVLGFGCSGALLASAKLYEQAQVLVIGTGVAAPAISDAGEYIFRTWPSDARAAALLYSYIADRQQKLGFMTEQTEYGAGFQKAFEQEAAAGKLQVLHEAFLTGDTDFGPSILKLKRSGSDSLFINAQSETTFLAVLSQARTLQLNLPVFGVYPPSSDDFRKQAGTLAEGIIYADTPSLAEVLNPGGEQAYQRFLQRYKVVNTWPAAFVSSYEAFRALHQALQSRQDVREYLNTSTFQGIFGEWSFDRKGDIRGLGFVLKEIKNDAVRTIRR